MNDSIGVTEDSNNELLLVDSIVNTDVLAIYSRVSSLTGFWILGAHIICVQKNIGLTRMRIGGLLNM